MKFQLPGHYSRVLLQESLKWRFQLSSSFVTLMRVPRYASLQWRSSRGCVLQWRASVQSGNNLLSSSNFAEENPFVKPLSGLYPVVPCRFCKGSGQVRCDVCDGQGTLARGGYHKKNPVSLTRIVGSKWTAMESTFGWRHFHVNSKRRGPGKDWFLEMVSTCEETTRFWVNAQNLKDRERWSSGWLQKVEIMGEKVITAASLCKACKGKCKVQCRSCARSEGDRPNASLLDIIEV